MSEKLPDKHLDTLYREIRKIIEGARSEAYQSANKIMVQAYWNIGRLIVEQEQQGENRAAYGKELIKELAQRLSAHGKGFDKRNLWFMRQFYQQWPKVNALRSELSWTHYRLLLKVEKEGARQYYIQEAIDNGWSTRTLERQINNLYYERILASNTRDRPLVQQEAEQHKVAMTPQDIIKDPYVLDFLGLDGQVGYLENDIEQGLVDNLQKFLLELGKGFSFVDRQYHIAVEDDHFYVDLVFYNYLLKCFVLIDLKLGKLSHQDLGQMDMYVRYFEDVKKPEGDNPTIGLILCAEKNNTMAKYSLLNESKQIYASKYKTYLPSEEELKKEIERGRRQIEIENKLSGTKNKP